MSTQYINIFLKTDLQKQKPNRFLTSLDHDKTLARHHSRSTEKGKGRDKMRNEMKKGVLTD